MSTGARMAHRAETSPRSLARVAGAIAWVTVSSGFAAAVRGKLVVSGDAAATAGNIMAHELLYRVAFAGDIIAVLYIAYVLLLYYLFKPVNRKVSLLAALFGTVGCAVGTLNCLFSLAPLIVLQNAQPLRAFNGEQLQALALLFLKIHAQGSLVSMVLFGAYNLLIGYLIFRSTFMPRILGVLLAISGLCYEFNNFASFLSPLFASHLVPYILIPGVAELLVAFWLLVFSINDQKWQQQASAARA